MVKKKDKKEEIGAKVEDKGGPKNYHDQSGLPETFDRNKTSYLGHSTEELDFSKDLRALRNIFSFTSDTIKGVISLVLSNKPWVLYGKSDGFPDFLRALYLKSHLHKRCILGKKKMLEGSGVTFEKVDEKVGDPAFEAAKKELEPWNLNEVHPEICFNTILYGGSWNQEIRKGNADTDGKAMTLDRIFLPDFPTMRKAKKVFKGETDIEGEQLDSFYKRDWLKGNHKGNKRIKIPYKHEKNNKKTEVAILINCGEGIDEYYPIPDYYSESAIDAIIVDREVMKFDRADLENGMNIGYIVTFFRADFTKTDPEKEERLRQQENDLIRKRMKGSENTNRVIVRRTVPGGDQKSVEVTPIPTNNVSDRHAIIDKRKNLAILSAHGFIAPELAGISGLASDGFSSEAERIKIGYELMIWNVIGDLKKKLEEYYNSLIKDYTNLKDVIKIVIPTSLPIISTISDNILKYAFKENEIRKMFGHEDLTDEELKELKLARANKFQEDLTEAITKMKEE